MILDHVVACSKIRGYSPLRLLAGVPGRFLAYAVNWARCDGLSPEDPPGILHLFNLCGDNLKHVVSLLSEFGRRWLFAGFQVDSHCIEHIVVTRVEFVSVVACSLRCCQ